MTKKELIARLAEMPDDAVVYVEDGSGTLVETQIERHEGESGTFADGFIVLAIAE